MELSQPVSAKNTLIWRFRGESVQGKSSSLSGILTYASATLETNYNSEIFGSLSPPAGALHVKTHHLFLADLLHPFGNSCCLSC